MPSFSCADKWYGEAYFDISHRCFVAHQAPNTLGPRAQSSSYERNTKTIVNINNQAQYSGTSGSIQRIVLFGTQAIKPNKIGNSTQINPLMSLTSQWVLLNQVPLVQLSNIFTQMYLLPHLWHFATVQVPSVQPGSFCSGKSFCWTGNFWELVEISKFSESFHSSWYVTMCEHIQVNISYSYETQTM